MIDLHYHILHGIDDGEKIIVDSLAMLHYKNGCGDNKRISIQKSIENLQYKLDNRNISMTNFPSQEARVTRELIEDIQKGKNQFIDEANQYLFMEFPSAIIHFSTGLLFFELQKFGVAPIIIHPEKNM